MNRSATLPCAGRSEMAPPEKALITGASGFVGQHLCPAVEAAGYELRCASRSPHRARRKSPDSEWVSLDLDDVHSVEAALQGCDAAFYLVHGLDAGADYPACEARAAEIFVQAARRSSLGRLVYLGGVEPRGEVSVHLGSRLRTGQILREGFEHTVELRAGVIIGRGSASFTLMRDLVARLPALALGDWMLNRSSPVAIDDVVAALLAALLLPDLQPGYYDVTGPEQLSHRNLLRRVAALLGRDPLLLSVPALSPTLAAYAVSLVSRTDLRLARQLVPGLGSDLVPERGHSIWEQFPEYERRSVDAAIHDALSDELSAQAPSARTRQRLVRLATRLAASVGA